ncbi:sensor histidine kinase [Siphonobacter aquaeclarae]|uniref:Histidine kinase n=1 Tax=Siphonobacter aquaeclarae TaxID=563176 RepID=A0A1G9YR27_9BACT|nr:histidine kinase [Siphonobacter aquaeclarae]SDN10886.1 Histidine kinase [Siphonobacter aquaeclarae]
MKLNINRLLPFALAAILPGLNFFSNTGALADGRLDFYGRWLSASLVLYVLWYLLQYATNRSSRYQWGFTAAIILAYMVLVYSFFSIFVFIHHENIRWNLLVKFFFASLLFLIIQYALRASSSIARLELEKEQIQSENYRVLLQQLRSKVDPHFLFNSLNTLRIMARKQHPSTEQFIISLSEFYRQTLKYNEASTVPLREELSVLKSYLFLIQTRNEGNLDISFQIDERLLDFLIPTLSLQIVVENCFKHNAMTSANPLSISVSATDDFYVVIQNRKIPKLSQSPKSGYGLDNIRQRYTLLNVQQGMLISESDTHFEVKLKLI